jgi:cytoskeleton protein RodZ
MDEVDPGQPSLTPAAAKAGDRLRAAREARGLSLTEISARTRVPQRHLEALESGDYTSLPSPTYAVGFSKAYARAVGADEVAVAQDVRRELDRLGPRTPEYVPYETADPARVPSRGVTIIALGIAVAVLVLVGLWYGTTLFRGGASRQVATTETSGSPAPVVASAPVPAAKPAVPTGGQVTLTANDEVWLRVYDADNKVLRQGTMKAGERYDVPADAKDPMINVGRPDKLTVTLNGSAAPALGTGERPIKDVRVSAAAVAARIAGTPEPAAAAPSPSAAAGATTGGNRRRTTRPAPSSAQAATTEPSTGSSEITNSSTP